MTNINLKTFPAVQSDSKAWLASPHGTEPNAMPSVTVDTALFTAGDKANGYIPSGVLVSETATETASTAPTTRPAPAATASSSRPSTRATVTSTSAPPSWSTATSTATSSPAGLRPSAAIAADLPLVYVY